jgi:outer membrane protein OmpA-like peptidoglycan-associated protein
MNTKHSTTCRCPKCTKKKAINRTYIEDDDALFDFNSTRELGEREELNDERVHEEIIYEMFPIGQKAATLPNLRRVSVSSRANATKQRKIIIDKFLPNKPSLSPYHVRQIEAVARQVVESWQTPRPIQSVRLVGYREQLSEGAAGLRLARQRAQTVGTMLKQSITRLKPDLAQKIQIKLQHASDDRSATSSRSKVDRARNRRVELFFSN